MSSRFMGALCFLALLGLLGGTGHAAEAQRVASINTAHYRGTWLEVGRTPMLLTNGCVAGYSTYKPGSKPNEVIVEDGCRVDSPNGRLKTIHGSGLVTDFGSTNAKMRVRYPLLITFNYWVLYEAPEKSWFISATPDMANLWIYAREKPSKRHLQRMVRKARLLGYDTQKLEFPAQ